MRYKNGAPKKLYVVVDQADGAVFPFNSKKEQNKFAKEETDTYDATVVKATYILVEE